MSRSYKKPVSKDNTHGDRFYNQIYRANWNRITRMIASLSNDDMDNIDYPQPNSMVDQYDICDWCWNYIGQKLGNWNDDFRKRLTRK